MRALERLARTPLRPSQPRGAGPIMILPDDPSRFLRDPALRTRGGAVIRLPVPFDPGEAALSGNARELAGGVVAVYDGMSQTGAIFTPITGRWTMLQPIPREEFEQALTQAGEMGPRNDLP